MRIEGPATEVRAETVRQSLRRGEAFWVLRLQELRSDNPKETASESSSSHQLTPISLTTFRQCVNSLI